MPGIQLSTAAMIPPAVMPIMEEMMLRRAKTEARRLLGTVLATSSCQAVEIRPPNSPDSSGTSTTNQSAA